MRSNPTKFKSVFIFIGIPSDNEMLSTSLSDSVPTTQVNISTYRTWKTVPIQSRGSAAYHQQMTQSNDKETRACL